jgi:hypothetical protein
LHVAVGPSEGAVRVFVGGSFGAVLVDEDLVEIVEDDLQY